MSVNQRKEETRKGGKINYLPSNKIQLTPKGYMADYLCFASSETVNFFLPLALRAARTLRPLADAILSLKPCLFLLFRCDG